LPGVIYHYNRPRKEAEEEEDTYVPTKEFKNSRKEQGDQMRL
jgi:hypothetical protein